MHRIETNPTLRPVIRKPYLSVFRNEQGAIDLASVMVGVIVIGMIGGVISATIFAVIPWAQDSAAKHQLDNIVTAESAYMGYSSATPSLLPAGTPTNSYGYSNELEAANVLIQSKTYCVIATPDRKGYDAYAQSASGNVFTASDRKTKPALYNAALPADCQFIADSYKENSAGNNPTPNPSESAPVEPTPTAPYVDPTPSLTILTYKCTTTTTGKIPMDGSIVGKETWAGGSIPDTTYAGAISPTNKTLQAGVEYIMTFEGTYASFLSSNLTPCLTSMDHWGQNTGVVRASSAFYGAGRLTSVPENIPTTITNMDMMFFGTTIFNHPNIGKWDVSNVTSMFGMFNKAAAFNQNINNWNVGKVQTMQYMFYIAPVFNQPLDKWNVSSVTNMSYMFESAPAFNQNINSWNVSNVQTTKGMFWAASAFNQPLDQWNVSNVTDMYGMFYGAKVFNQDINSWNVSKVLSMAQLFHSASAFDKPLSNWDVRNVTTLQSTFYNTAAFNQDLSNWDVSNVKDMFGTFGWTQKFNNASISNWNVGQVTDMRYMFSHSYVFDQSLNNWNVSNVTDARWMFEYAAAFNGDIGNWNITKMTSTNGMFFAANKFNKTLNTWDVSNLTQTYGMFYNAGAFNQPLDKWNVSNVRDMTNMFQGTVAFNQDISMWNVSNVTTMYAMFYRASGFSQDLSGWNTSPTMNGTYFCSSYFPPSFRPKYTTAF